MTQNISDIAVKTLTGEAKKMSDYAGSVLLLVNVASYCGYTGQYTGLEALNQKFAAQGLKVIGIPCNDFGAQEPDSNEQIATFCDTKYGVTFDMLDKVKILGGDKHPLYAALTTAVEPQGDVKWNFEKFLVDRQGNVVGRYPSSTTPEALESIISQAL
ncbi:glutathione peroxidase [filamentous cyanobacterium LEGE 11480]|uniref:Glutathione peroxidase n=1 Tax=Romeriopsis navalis LEGE 11480 TaxID=2777977 RepID=A0A928VLI0_9CYAN|nr:glutathione peroxidase [Romeriopsis navalis]MBE9030525.1 glutathione peroxidase [Romeriopsis navalis LEGE 11480]